MGLAFGDFDLTKTKDILEDIPPQSPLISNSYPGAFSDFYGFPSHPICVYRTGDEWPMPKGPQAQRVPRGARPVCNHPIRALWRTLGEQVYKFLDSLEVLWSTIDPVRFAEEEGEAGPLYLWVGVIPRSLSLEVAKVAAVGCKKILAAAQFPHVEIAFRESVFTRSAGPQLLNHPFTGTLGVQIAPRNTSHFEGTGALYLCEGGQSNRVFLLTTRHVALPPSVHHNELYERKRTSQPRHEVLILGSKAYPDTLEALMADIGRELIFVDHFNRELAALGEAVEGEDATVAEVRQEFKGKLAKAEKTIMTVNAFHSDIAKHWSTASQRVIGHVIYAPPISVGTGPKPFTEDWALIELNRDKIDWNNFKGNAVYLGNKISAPDFVLKMHPHPEGRSAFKYPVGSLLHVKGIVKEEIRQPTLLDANGEECLIVIKNGKSTGITIGLGSDIESFIRVYDEYGIKSTSMEIAIHPYNHKDGAFSAPGDSGSIVVDGLGRIIGLLTGGSGTTGSTDVTYVTPYSWVEEQIKKAFPDSYLYPIKG
ncbi:uncharacterized protein EI90DRAFT_3145403 [Cantharellus anzutake]|uniref:uncharacterized protein n=1 Tax=Cantharellus anzutake TaxID=1750568 RepID=UPI00190755ED|nr:uncharacterized protein EI90DRAFT_3145403 [Cantharellus anzutake]KAF8332800.1 hypothetical protein EI90DRAFT_3145403 [Cantharellus anzutake]